MSREAELRQRLFENYRQTQGAFASGVSYEDIQALWPYFESNYLRFLGGLKKSAAILEVGCGPGSLLSWLRHRGFENLQGVDASPEDVGFANGHLGQGTVTCGEAHDYFRRYPKHFDCILMKAVLEHQPKDQLLSMVETAARSLKDSGVLVIDVPNMDWICAGHERYMDLTHEIGFTRESLKTLLSLFFERVEIHSSVPGTQTRSQRWLRRPLIRIMRRILYLLGEGASDVLFESRSIIALARAPR